jgi:muramoyltetrapeptide carboxypeptidase
MVKPEFLNPGDTIGIVSPGKSITPDRVMPVIQLIEAAGFKVVTGNSVFSADHQFAGSDKERAADLEEMIRRKDVKAILASRGGYGSARLIRQVDFSPLTTHPKWIAGFSDITVIHAYLARKTGICSIHSAMPYSLTEPGADPSGLEKLMEVLSGSSPVYNLPAHPLNREGRAKGILTGGNLSMLYSIRGTDFEDDYDGKILFLEEVGEYLYHLDRMMSNLKFGGILGRLKGLLVGGLTEMKDNNIPFGMTAEEIIRSWVDEYDYPLLFGFPAGHGSVNLPLIMGGEVELFAGKDHASVHFY